MLSLDKSIAVTSTALEAGIKATSLADLMLRAEIEAADIKPGSLDDWLKKQKTDNPTWFNDQAKPETPPSPAAPATPPAQTEENPWAKDTWNMTRQGDFLKKHGTEKAEQMAAAAGTTIGGLRPTKAPTTPIASPALNTPRRDSAGRFLPEEPNPFGSETWNLTEQMRLYKADPAKAEKLAKAAGTTIGATRPQPALDRAFAIVYKTRRR